MFFDIMQTGINLMAASSGMTNTTDESVTDMIDSAAEATNEAAKEVNQFVKFVQDNIPTIIGFGIKVILALVFFFLGGKVIKWVRKIVNRSFERTHVDAAVVQFVDSMIKFGLYALLIFMIATNFGIESSSIAALIASAGVAIGLAVQGSLSNFAGGVLILLLKPFRTGDYIVAQGQEGSVKEINLFNTVLATPDNKTIIIPNGSMSNSIVNNVTDSGTRRIEWTFGIAYGDDYDRARQVLQGLIDADERIFKTPASLIALSNLADSAVQIVVRAWVKADDYWSVFYDMNEKVYKVFPEHGLTIPFNQLDVNIASLPSPADGQPGKTDVLKA